MPPKNVYVLLAVLGTVIPYSQFTPWVMEHGLDVRLLIDQLFANRISAFFGLDVIVSTIVVFAFAIYERRRMGSRWWMPLAAALLIGVSAALPLLLYLRESRSVESPATRQAQA